MSAREVLPSVPPSTRQQLNFDLRDKQLAMLDDNARFIVRRMVGRAYAEGYDDGWHAGQDDARCDAGVQRDQESRGAR